VKRVGARLENEALLQLRENRGCDDRNRAVVLMGLLPSGRQMALLAMRRFVSQVANLREPRELAISIGPSSWRVHSPTLNS